ncbi:MAG: hypothetical protein AB7F38_00045 [Piscinibacter sp.]
MQNPIEYFPTSEARASLAALFGLVYEDKTQDWEWEVAAPDRFEEFLHGYSSLSLSDAERFSLMEVLLQCIEDSETPQLVVDRWAKLEPHLVKNIRLHRQTVEYWSCAGAAEQEGQFRITPLVRHQLSLASARE